jgi:nitrogen fixation-related uncharacterized protein
MELLVVTLALVALGLAAMGWGVDSRDPMTDDHRR